MTAKRAVFVCCVRNSASALPAVLANIERYSDLFASSAVLLLENDSRDATPRIIADWCRARSHAQVITVPGLGANPIRTLCLASVRNRALQAVRDGFADYDYLFVMDGDEVNAAPADPENIRRAVIFLEESDERSAVFANSAGAYFDLWALRHPQLCPRDVWEELADYVIAHRVPDAAAYDATLAKRVFALAPEAPPLEVDSAFGGLGIYKISHVMANPRRYGGAKIKTVPLAALGLAGNADAALGWQVCEHVAFHAGLRARGGRLFVLPFLVTCSVASTGFPPHAWRSFLFPLSAPGVPVFSPEP